MSKSVISPQNTAGLRTAGRWLTRAVGVMCTIMACGAAAQAASFRGMGDLPDGAFNSAAKDIVVLPSGELRVAGWCTDDTGTQAALWKLESPTAPSTCQGLGDLPGGVVDSQAFKISPDGTYVVGIGNSTKGSEGFLWSQSCGMVGLGDLPSGDFYSNANGVTGKDGLPVAVGLSSPAENRSEAFRWEADPDWPTTCTGKMNGLGDVPNGPWFGSQARYITVTPEGVEVIVGGPFPFDSGCPSRWINLTQQCLDLSPAGLGPNGFAYSASPDARFIVGTAQSSEPPCEGFEAFRWTEDGVPIRLGDLPGGACLGYARAVSADGSIVVGTSETEKGEQAFIWDQIHGMRNLRDVLQTDFGLNLQGWTLQRAEAISNDGLIIVGVGLNPNGNPEAWLADLHPVVVPLLSISDVSVTEGNFGTASAIFTVSLSVASDQTVTVDYAAADGMATGGVSCASSTDYVTKNGMLTFNPNETLKMIPIAVCGDTRGESNETFFINLVNATNATIADGQGQGMIIDDDCPDPIMAINNQIIDVKNLGLAKGTENSLIAKLNAAKSSLEKCNTTAAKGQLNAFINEVGALRGKKISEADADNLIAQAQAIIDCPPACLGGQARNIKEAPIPRRA